MNGSLETVDGHPALRFERRLAHPVERVWRAVTEPAELERWFPGAVAWKPEAGEVFEAGGETGEITELDSPRLIAWTFGPDRFRFELGPDGGGCLLVFTHVFQDRELGAQTAAGWETYLDRLDVHLDGRELAEEAAHQPIAEYHERYADRLGLDPTPGRRFIAGCPATTAASWCSPTISPTATPPPGRPPDGTGASPGSTPSWPGSP